MEGLATARAGVGTRVWRTLSLGLRLATVLSKAADNGGDLPIWIDTVEKIAALDRTAAIARQV